jgi:anti-sigma B factor antagonist
MPQDTVASPESTAQVTSLMVRGPVPVLCAAVKPAHDEQTPHGGGHVGGRPGREQLMTVRWSDQDDAIILTVCGEIDGLTAPRLRMAIAETFDRLGGRLLVVDLTEVTLLGSPGLRTLRDSAEEAVHHRGLWPLRIVVDEARPVIRPIEMVGLDQILALYHSVSDALAGDGLHS